MINLIENICNKLTLKIRKEMPEVDDERAEVINYGLQLVIGEIPKTFVLNNCIHMWSFRIINNCIACNYAI